MGIQEATSKRPIFVYTDSVNQAPAAKALELGAVGYIHKNEINTNLLFYTIRSAIGRQQQLNILKEQPKLEFEKRQRNRRIRKI